VAVDERHRVLGPADTLISLHAAGFLGGVDLPRPALSALAARVARLVAPGIDVVTPDGIG
jgi:hypothetical protein